jgi:hypothetical protein
MTNTPTTNAEHTIELTEGYEGHTAVTFGRRVLARDLFTLDTDPQAELNTQYQLLILRRAITKFGDIPNVDPVKSPVLLKYLLSMKVMDIRDLINGYNEFEKLSEEENERQKPLSIERLQFAHPFKVREAEFDIVVFGRQLTGFDEVEADRLRLKGESRAAWTNAQQVVRVENSESGESVTFDFDDEEGERLTLESLGGLTTADLNFFNMGAELYRQSFRRKRKVVSGERGGGGRAGAGDKDGVDGGVNSQPPA